MTELEAKQIWIDPNDADVVELSHKLVIGLLERYGEAKTIGVLMQASCEVLIGVLHMPSPNPEGNIDSTRRLLDSMRDLVMDHASCAISAGEGYADTPKGKVH